MERFESAGAALFPYQAGRRVRKRESSSSFTIQP
jgi:hypothetical protein